MPKIVGGVPPFIGTQDNLTIYLMNGEYIIRTKSSLTGKRVKHDPAFAKTMKYAGWLKQGSRIASGIYRQLPDEKRVYKRYRELTGKAMHLLKEGFDTADVITMLEALYLPQPVKNTAGKYTDGYNDDCSGINMPGDVYLSQTVKNRAGKETKRYRKDCNEINMPGDVYLSQTVEGRADTGTERYRDDCSEINMPQTVYQTVKGRADTGTQRDSEVCSEGCSEGFAKYSRDYTAKSSGRRITYSGVQIRSHVSKCGCNAVGILNSRRGSECGSTKIKDNVRPNGKCAEESINMRVSASMSISIYMTYEHKYILPYYCFGDRPPRAVQEGITGLSYLKYADATDRGLIEILKPIRPTKAKYQRTSKNDSQ